MRKSFIVIAVFVVLAVLVSCNPDQISGFGSSMEKLGDLGLGNTRKEPMNEAIENVNAFIKKTERQYLYLVEITEPKLDDYLNFKSPAEENKAAFVNTVDQTVNVLLAAKDSSARSKDLRDALNAKYEGDNESPAYKNLHEGLSHEAIFAGNILNALEDPENRNNLVMLLSSVLHTSVTGPQINDAVQKLKDTNLPIPLQAGDYSMIIGQLFTKVQAIIKAVKSSSSGSGSGGSKFNKDALVQFERDIMNSVGDRTYQTVGDKIVVDIIYSFMYTICLIDSNYQSSPEYGEPGHEYDRFLEYVFTNGKGLDYVDKMLNYLDAISYIYDVKLDITGIVRGNM